MSFIIRKTYSEPAPEGLHNAVCCDVVDLGVKIGKFGKQDKVRLIFQLEEINMKAFEGPQPFRILRDYTKSLGEKASLRKDLKSWRGKDLTREELEGFDLEKLIGVNAQIQVVHTMSDTGGVFGNIAAIVPPAKNQVPLKVVAYQRVKDRTVGEAKGNAPQKPRVLAPAQPDDDDIPF